MNRVQSGLTIGTVVKELGLVEQTLRKQVGTSECEFRHTGADETISACE